MTSLIIATDLSHVIALAVTPVFLLAGIAGFLNVMSGRLGRIVDRARVLELRIINHDLIDQLDKTQKEIVLMWLRVNIINRSIVCCTSSGLLVCLLIVTLFIGNFWRLDIDALIVILFVSALLMLIVSLILFAKEVVLATNTLKMDADIFAKQID